MTTNEFREERLANQVRELAAKFLELEAGPQSLITVTSVKLLDRNKRATVFFTVLPDSKTGAALDFAKRKRSEFREYVKKNSQIGLVPFFDFEIDLGEKNRQRIDELSWEDKGNE